MKSQIKTALCQQFQILWLDDIAQFHADAICGISYLLVYKDINSV